MASLGPAPSSSSNALIDRVKAILMSPASEFRKIDIEPSSIGQIYRSHVIPLAAIGPVASLIGGLAFGTSMFGITYRPSIVAALTTAVVSYLIALVGVYLLALVIDLLAPQFGATPNRTQAFKVAAYSATAGWVAGIFGLLPAIAFLGIVGLYSLYLIYVGLPIVMKAPADKATSYTVVVVLVMLVGGLVLGAVVAPIAALMGPSVPTGSVSGAVTVPGVGSLDMGKLEAASKRMEEAAKRAESGQPAQVIAPDVLQGLLPASLGALPRTSIESSSAGSGGIGGSQAEARYGAGDNEISLKVTDMGAMGGLAAMGGALNIQSSKQTATGYEKVGNVDGRMTTEKYDSSTKSGSYSTIVGDRVMVEAEGNAPSADAFKAAVASIDLARVEGLAKQVR